MQDFTRIVLPDRAKPETGKPKIVKSPPRDALARTIATVPELGAFVNTIRSGLAIHQAELAARARVSRQWIVALEQGKPTLEAGRVLRTLEALGFEITLTPYAPAPPWMLRAVRAAHAKRAACAEGRRVRRNGRRARARELKLAGNTSPSAIDVE